MRSTIYKWHRRLSIIIAVPVLLWAVSGFMHPIMTNIRPAIASQAIRVVPIDSQRIRISLQTACRMHHIDSFSNFQLVHIDTNWFYQLQPAWHRISSPPQALSEPTQALSAMPQALFAPQKTSSPHIPAIPRDLATPDAANAAVPIYLSCTNGNILPAGDWLYAQYLARQFLEGPAVIPTAAASSSQASSSSPVPTPASSPRSRSIPVVSAASLPRPILTSGSNSSPVSPSYPEHNTHDCCGAATDAVLNPVKGAKVANVSLLRDFNHEYKYINRLLPVYCVSFERADGIRIYVETTCDRFSFAMDNRRAIFDEIFRLFHTYGWLDWLGKGRLAIEVTLALLACCTTLMGIYIFFITRAPRKPKSYLTGPPVTANSPAHGHCLGTAPRHRLVAARRNHRYVSLVASLFTLLWTFSGAWHAFAKFKDDTRDKYFIRDNFPAASTGNIDLTRLQNTVGIAPITNIAIARIDGQSYWRVNTMPRVSYVSTANYSLLPDGDARYADWLATQYSGQPTDAILSTTPVTSFGDEYNFADKRLPVWKVSFSAHNHERYYIETSTGRLASKVDDRQVREGWSFSVFHKHHFMDGGGKTVRDISTMFWALAQIAMVLVGLILWFRSRRRK